MVIGSYLRYVAVNFQRLHNTFGRVGYVNLTDDQGLFKEYEGDAKGREELLRSMSEVPRRVKDDHRSTTTYGGLRMVRET